MAGRVQGKVALVTGGSSGIGRACAERLAQEGAIVVLTDLQDEKGQALAAEIEANGGKAQYRHQDVTSEQEWIDTVAAIKADHGRLDILVNNAGIGISGSVLDMALSDFQRQVAINLDGVFLG
nr:SDR family NAD(P)-dependent oxidoreductase [Phenylobacterium glaciei]